MTHTTQSNQVFTVGHSNHEIDAFVQLLQRNGVTAIADVRSSPYSRFSPQFNRDTLKSILERHRIAYVFMGEELGARRAEPECYDGPTARYDLIAKSPAFHRGLQRLKEGMSKYQVAMMCAEKDPITCHRMVLVAHALKQNGVTVLHIRENGEVESNDEAEERMLNAVGLPASDLFQSRDQLVEQAYERQGRKIAWSESEGNANGDQGP